MNSEIRQLLERVKTGETSVEDALLRLKMEPFEDIGYAKVDMHRKVRQGAAEVIYGAGKTPEQIAGIVETMKKKGVSQYTLIKKYGVSPGQLTRMKRNESVSTHTIEMFCRILACDVSDVMAYLPDEEN